MANSKVKVDQKSKSKPGKAAPRKQARPVGRVSVPTVRLDEEQLSSLAHQIAEIMLRGDEEAASIPPEPRSALELACELFGNPATWLKMPNSQLGDRKPIDLIGTDEEFRVQNLLTAIDQGLF